MAFSANSERVQETVLKDSLEEVGRLDRGRHYRLFKAFCIMFPQEMGKKIKDL